MQVSRMEPRCYPGSWSLGSAQVSHPSTFLFRSERIISLGTQISIHLQSKGNMREVWKIHIGNQSRAHCILFMNIFLILIFISMSLQNLLTAFRVGSRDMYLPHVHLFTPLHFPALIHFLDPFPFARCLTPCFLYIIQKSMLVTCCPHKPQELLLLSL